MPRRRTRLAACLLAAAGPAAAATGTVIDPAGKPIAGARVCHFMDNIEILCAISKDNGSFDIIDSTAMPMRVTAEGFLPEVVPAAGHQEITLRRAPILLVRLVDAQTAAPIDRGEVLVVYSPTEAKGPFPANRAGVRIQRLLRPGPARLVGRAEGYLDSRPEVVTIEAGKEVELTLRLEPRPRPRP